ncbi:hypothetical protein [Sporosarcina sp. YIM B06819]|uniref:hypothetical protein n=1 Tax=Sporosarcina sp. YIM B06819 TaxID=3081769 RepID=UPI00298BFB43|nr:hypothetical protein [Sporosarcina sp. YIM B06819]
MEKDYYVLPKDTFLEVLLDTAKEKCFLQYAKAKSELAVRETVEGTFDDYVLDTINCLEETMQGIKEMDYQEFLWYLLYENKGRFLENGNSKDSLYNLVENLVPLPQIFVDRGYERHTV